MQKSIKHLKNNEVIIFPAETLYGFSCSFYSEKAIKKIFEIKQRKPQKQFIILVGSFEMALKIIETEKYKIDFLKKYKYWPNHLTVIFKSKIQNYETLALRYSNADHIKELFKNIDFPIISTSVNYSGQPPLNDINKIQKAFADIVSYINITSPPFKGKASTIIDFTKNEPELIRSGEVPYNKIKEDYEEFQRNNNR